MSTDDEIMLPLSKSEALVLFEFARRFTEVGKLDLAHPSEKQALWNLACILESQLGEPFQKNYQSQLERARTELNSDK